MTYRLSPDLKEVVDEKGNRFLQRGFTEKHLGVDLREGESFTVEQHCTINNNHYKVINTTIDEFSKKSNVFEKCRDCYLVAVAVPATEETNLTVRVNKGGDDYTNGVFDYIVVLNQRIDAKELESLIAGASSQKEEIEIKIDRLKEVLEDLIEAIPKQLPDSDWWEDNLTNAVGKAKLLIEQLNSNK